ncbi:Serine/threonine-protein phosphatase CPPED1 [Araneus ventricosus]|uniref:Serine/threonine-protein phosphatase CPPED1 n=1 Tax=Araneus ventricosus TaxID=182803 RepID=A0A4Y2SQR5_ARAVE|nr:Serine/threonine-protein phosphatase CPPED1 [Araneus ventricosus]
MKNLLIVIGFWITIGSNFFSHAGEGETAPFGGSIRGSLGENTPAGCFQSSKRSNTASSAGTRLRHPQEQSFFRAFRELHPDIPLVCVCGNHDVGDNPTQESIQTYKSKFGDDYFTFYCGGVKFIVINSQFYKASEQVQDLAAEHDRWLDEQLEEAKSGKYKHVVIFQHIPWFIRNPDEEDLYFNINTEIREKMLKKFYEANVRAVFCGHWHGNAGGFYKDLEVVVTSAIGGQLRGDRSGLRVIKVLDSAIRHNYYALGDVPKEISLD